MALYKIVDGNLSLIKSKPFSFEKEIQTLTEKNLDTLFNLVFICSVGGVYALQYYFWRTCAL
jgi:hypothetical protein